MGVGSNGSEMESIASETIRVVGIDPSITGTAAVIYHDDGTHTARRFPSAARGKGIRERNNRYLATIANVIKFLGDDPIQVIAIEGYSFGSTGQQNFIAEYGGLLRADLCVYESAEIVEVAPSTLKKFVTGKGNADKVAVVTKVLRQWGAGFATDDEFDAYGLARIAACIAGMEPPENTKQSECLKTITDRDFEVVNKRSVFPQPAVTPLPF